MRSVTIWCWQAGWTADGSPVLAKCPLTETPQEGAWQAEQDVDAWREEIMDELERIDLKSIRAMRAGEAARLAALDARAEQLRGWLRGLNA